MANHKRKLELYEQIFQAFGPGTSRCQINQLADLLYVSDRHVQTLIKNMAELGWIQWEASSGRNKKASLSCLIEPIDACYDIAKQYADAGNVEQVINTLSFGGRDTTNELQAFLNHSNKAAQQVAYIPFHRQLEDLHPLETHRRTERFLITQVCQRLTSVRQGEVIGDLAYHWQSNEDATVWRFQIRNEVQFHDGSQVSPQDIKRCLNALAKHAYWKPCYSHISKITAATGDSIDIHLSQTDWHLPRLLARSEASVFQPTNSNRLNGSGPFSLDICSSNMLRLSRNRHYSHAVAILNRIELWVYPEWAKDKTCAQNQICLEMPDKTDAKQSQSYAKFLMIQNPKHIASSRHYTYEDTAECKTLFAQLSKKASRGTLVNYGDYSATNETTLCSIIDEADSFGTWLSFLSRYPFSKHDFDAQVLRTITAYLTAIRAERNFSKSSDSLTELRDWLTEQGVVQELKHESFQLEVSEKLQGIDVNGYGWCELNQIWISAHPLPIT